MRKPEIDIENNILHFIHNDSDYLIDLDQLEMVYFNNGCVSFHEGDETKVVKEPNFNKQELERVLIQKDNFVYAGFDHVVNIVFINYIDVERCEDSFYKFNVNIKFKSGTKISVTAESFESAERLYDSITTKMWETKNVSLLI